MALPPKTNPTFENPDAGGAAADAAVVADPPKGAAQTFQQPTPQPAPQSTAVATVAPRAVAVARAPVSPFAELQNAYTVDYNTLDALMVSNGSFLMKEDAQDLGNAITMQLMSYQKSFVVSPGDDSEQAKKLVKYSDDGAYTKDGLNINDYLQELKSAGYSKAYKSERVVLVGALADPGKLPALQDRLVQLDLAPTSKTLYDRYTIQAAFDIGRGKTTLEKSRNLRMTAKVTKNANNKIYTLVQFTEAA